LIKPSPFRIKIPRVRIRTRIMVAFLGLPITSLIIFGYFALNDIKKIGNYALESGSSLGTSATNDSTAALEALGEKIIAQKAADVALQCKVYLKARQGITIGELRKSKDFNKIAVQSVGKTGYTILYEKNGIMRFHPNPELIDYDMHNWKDKLPDFWAIFEKTFSGSPANGYYDWQELDGKIRRKFMAIDPVPGTPYMVAATTYIDEFSIPVTETREKIQSATQTINEHVNERMEDIYTSFIVFLMILILVVFSISYLLSNMITNPIMALIEGVRAIGRGDIDYRVLLKTEDEFEDLALAFNRMASDLEDQMSKLRRTTAEKEGLLKELEIASSIQQRLLPASAPTIKDIDIIASNIPAREVSGDFYDFIPIAEDCWGLVIADVSGKGMPAAMFMGLSRTIVRASTTGMPNPTLAIRQANTLICRDSTSGMFVTLFYAVLDPGKKLRYINAGHNPPLLFKQGTDNAVLLKARGLALGVRPDIDLQEEVVQLESGDLIVLYTDGITEAINEAGEAFGMERLIDVIQRHRSLEVGDILTAIQRSVIDFEGRQPQFDDITLMILRVR
jgi:sigma-B regulation protein RsbU (phosphoserine phosphatase)